MLVIVLATVLTAALTFVLITVLEILGTVVVAVCAGFGRIAAVFASVPRGRESF